MIRTVLFKQRINIDTSNICPPIQKKNKIVSVKFSLFSILILFLSLLIYHYEAYSQGWSKINTNYNNILRIFIPESNPSLVAISSSLIPVSFVSENLDFEIVGSGFQLSSDSGKTFGQTILDGHYVIEFCESSENKNEWYVSTSQLNRGRILLSKDTGKSWNENDVRCEATFHIFRMSASDNTSGFVAAAVKTGRGFITSDNGFINCTEHGKPNAQARDIRISKANPDMIFIASDNVYEEGVFRSTDKGLTWYKDEKGIERLRIHTVLPSSINPAIVFCGADTVDEKNGKVYGKGIYMSQDTGKTWEQILFTGSSVFELREHPSNPKYIVAACGTAGVWISANHGGYWVNYKEGLPEGSSVQTISVPDWELTKDGIIAFAGTAADGLYISSRMITSVEMSESLNYTKLVKEVFPQPANNQINITLNRKLSDISQFHLFDFFGNELKIEHNNIHISNSNILIELDNSFTNGLYNLVIHSSTQFESVPIILIKH